MPIFWCVCDHDQDDFAHALHVFPYWQNKKNKIDISKVSLQYEYFCDL